MKASRLSTSILMVLSSGLFACIPHPVSGPSFSMNANPVVLQPQFQFAGHELAPDQIQTFLIQKLQAQGRKAPLPDWRKHSLPAYDRSPELKIQSVTLANTGQSVMGPDAPASIVPEFEGKTVELLLTGTFATKQDKALNLKTFLFTYEPSLLHQSLAPGQSEPVSKVVLDDAILLTPISVSATQIRVRLNTRGLVDLMLAGTHKISLLHRKWYTDALVKISRPTSPPGDLQPRIESVELIRNESNQPRFLKCRIVNAMTQPKFAYATVGSPENPLFGFGYQTHVLEGNEGPAWETWIHVPDPDLYDHSSTHTLVYATPFGTAYRQF